MFSQKTFLSGARKSYLFLFHSFHVLNKGTEGGLGLLEET